MQTAAGRPGLSLTTVLWLVVLLAAAIAVATNIGELRRIGDAFRSAQWGYVAAAAAVEAAFVLNLALFYVSTFRASRVRAGVGRFVLLTSASYFVNLVSKTGGLGGIALYLREAKRTGEPQARVSAAYLTAYVIGYAAYLCVLVVTLLLLWARGSLRPAEIAAAAVILGIIVAAGLVLAVGLRSEAALGRLYLLAAYPANAAARLFRRAPFIDRCAARETVGELYEAVDHVKRNPRRYALPFAHALGVEVISAAMLFLIARALHANISVQAALAGYTISLLFSMVAITPSGLGFVEVSLSVLLVSFGLTRADAIAVALGYRLFEFWLPVLLGAVALQALRRGPAEAPG